MAGFTRQFYFAAQAEITIDRLFADQGLHITDRIIVSTVKSGGGLQSFLCYQCRKILCHATVTVAAVPPGSLAHHLLPFQHHHLQSLAGELTGR